MIQIAVNFIGTRGKHIMWYNLKPWRTIFVSRKERKKTYWDFEFWFNLVFAINTKPYYDKILFTKFPDIHWFDNNEVLEFAKQIFAK